MYERAPVRPSNQYFVVYDGATSVLHTRIRFKLLRVNFEQVQNSVWGHNGNLASCVAVVEWLLKKNPVWYWCIMTGRVILYALFSTCCIRSPTIELATLEFGSHPHATYVDLFLFTGLRRLMPCTWSKLLVVFVACVGAKLNRNDRRCLAHYGTTCFNIAWHWTVTAGVLSRFGTESSSRRVARPTIMYLSSFQACSPLAWRFVATFVGYNLKKYTTTSMSIYPRAHRCVIKTVVWVRLAVHNKRSRTGQQHQAIIAWGCSGCSVPCCRVWLTASKKGASEMEPLKAEY